MLVPKHLVKGVPKIASSFAIGLGFGVGFAVVNAVCNYLRLALKSNSWLSFWFRKRLGQPLQQALPNMAFAESAAPPSSHYLLRPNVDPRLDQSIFVRYDPPEVKKTGALFVVFPGGNYDECDVYCGEGQPVAQWLTTLGITAVVLRYRVISQGHYWPAQFEDWLTCAEAVFGNAKEWGCDPARVGVIGFSAGGHLASHAALNSPENLRPALQVLIYPAIDPLSPREGGDIDPWSPTNGYPPPESACNLYVKPGSPPAFLASMICDQYCPPEENTKVYAEALQKHGVPHLSVTNDEDEHGCGLQDWWTEPCTQWLVEKGWATQTQSPT